MSKIGEYVIWCQEEGYTNEHGEVDSMEYVDEYMKTQEYFKEHITYSKLLADNEDTAKSIQ